MTLRKPIDDALPHRTQFPDEFFARLRKMNIATPGQRLLDLTTGSSTLNQGFAHRECKVTTIDISASVLLGATILDMKENLQVNHVRSVTHQLPFSNHSFDVVSAGQCWQFIDQENTAIEIKRVLVSGGTLVIAQCDWLVAKDNLIDRTLRLVRQYNPSWDPLTRYLERGYGLYPAWLNEVLITGFEDIETFSFDVVFPYHHIAWRERVRTSVAAVATMPPDIIVQFDSALQNMLQTDFTIMPLRVPHRVWCIVCRKADTKRTSRPGAEIAQT